MDKNRKGVFAFLQRITNWGFWICLLVLLLSVASEIFTRDGAMGSIYIGNHHSKGYSIPVTVLLNYADSTFVYGKDEQIDHALAGTYSYYRQSTIFADSLRQRAVMNGCELKSSTYNNLTQYRIGQNNDVANWEYYSFGNLDGFLIANTSKWSLKTLIILNAYLGLIFLVLVFYCLSEFFYSLRTNLSFTIATYKTVNRTGLLLLIYVLIRFLISVVLAIFSTNIFFESITDGIPNIVALDINVRPRIVFDFTLFLVGLSLWGVSALFKKGAYIESENNLTI
ncbi:DUF2975 domain-containing protein [Carboxylicivirga sp. A043]|uniref:DUF2975 domain-containing protein n=1 Tax=Carboxylicivirga litoralis TaxID=2816963 RepID=UPI0021CB8A1D|nr:DUF2975 domain-containing protein [Carboxylicivirga sp. A043]MCU4154784.1 DUF2975 domain-containing protein [Carboxylicivirga sp. A043]